MATFRQEDIYQDDIYKNLRDSLESTLKVTLAADEAINKFHTDLDKAAQSLGSTAKDVRDLNKANAESKKALDDKNNVEKQTIKIEEQLQKVTKAQRIALAEVKIERQERPDIKAKKPAWWNE